MAPFTIPSESRPAVAIRACKTEDKPDSTVDFHRMSSRQLMQWINGEISAGRMSLDESTRYVTMTINGMPARCDGDPLAQSDAWRDEPRDYIADLNNGLAYARARGDEEESRMLLAMLERMRAGELDCGR